MVKIFNPAMGSLQNSYRIEVICVVSSTGFDCALLSLARL
jgi:hypothetical protein